MTRRKSKCNKEVYSYVMNDLNWKCDLPNFLNEITTCSEHIPYIATFRILGRILDILAQRAVELNDPALNIIMLNLSLYEGSHDKNIEEIRNELRKQIELKGNGNTTRAN